MPLTWGKLAYLAGTAAVSICAVSSIAANLLDPNRKQNEKQNSPSVLSQLNLVMPAATMAASATWKLSEFVFDYCSDTYSQDGNECFSSNNIKRFFVEALRAGSYSVIPSAIFKAASPVLGSWADWGWTVTKGCELLNPTAMISSGFGIMSAKLHEWRFDRPVQVQRWSWWGNANNSYPLGTKDFLIPLLSMGGSSAISITTHQLASRAFTSVGHAFSAVPSTLVPLLQTKGAALMAKLGLFKSSEGNVQVHAKTSCFTNPCKDVKCCSGEGPCIICCSNVNQGDPSPVYQQI